MKIRNGFVSNSSSSSFVVGFKTIPTTVEETMKMMFKEDQICVSTYSDDCHVYEIAKQVFKDIQESEPISKDRFIEIIKSGYFDGYPEHDYSIETPSVKFRKEWSEKKPDKSIWDDELASKKWSDLRQIEWEKEEIEIDKAALKLAENEWPDLKDFICFHFEYGDEDGPFFSIMEHAGIFKNLPHMRISHH